MRKISEVKLNHDITLCVFVEKAKHPQITSNIEDCDEYKVDYERLLALREEILKRLDEYKADRERLLAQREEILKRLIKQDKLIMDPIYYKDKDVDTYM